MKLHTGVSVCVCWGGMHVWVCVCVCVCVPEKKLIHTGCVSMLMQCIDYHFSSGHGGGEGVWSEAETYNTPPSQPHREWGGGGI